MVKRYTLRYIARSLLCHPCPENTRNISPPCQLSVRFSPEGKRIVHRHNGWTIAGLAQRAMGETVPRTRMCHHLTRGVIAIAPITVPPPALPRRGDVCVSYATTPITDAPRLPYTHRGALVPWRGTLMGVDSTPYGPMIVTGDWEEILCTPRMPTMRLSAAAHQAHLETIAVLRHYPVHKVQGPLQRPMAMCLSGTADTLSFAATVGCGTPPPC